MAERIFSRMEFVACLDAFFVFITKELPPTVLDTTLVQATIQSSHVESARANQWRQVPTGRHLAVADEVQPS
jgi:hypothetical protein